MINILIPLGTSSKFFEGANYQFPKPLIEISGKTMIQRVVENLSMIKEDKKFIFILREEDCTQYHLDDTVRMLAGDNVEIIKIQRETKGAACSALLAINLIANEDALIIANGDQLFDSDLNAYIEKFKSQNIDAGCIYFESVHPRWSFVRLEGDKIIETAEKRPISKSAIAGFFYFSNGKHFIDSAFSMIRKDASLNGQFFIAPVLNELVLAGKKLKAFSIPSNQYHTFYSPKKIEEFEMLKFRMSSL